MEQNENTLSVLKIAPGQYPQQVEIDNDLKALQQAVGGSIGASYPFEDTMVDKFSQVAGNIPVTNDDPNRRYTVINGYPVVLSFAKEPNPGVFDRIRDILLATSYTKTTS